MSGNLSHFLVDLASNPDQMMAFLADPERVFDAAGLTAEERDAIRSRDARRLNAVLAVGFQMQAGNTNNAVPKIKPPRKKRPAPKKKGPRKGGAKKGRRKTGSKKR
jgi:hypothetical protein